MGREQYRDQGRDGDPGELEPELLAHRRGDLSAAPGERPAGVRLTAELMSVPHAML